MNVVSKKMLTEKMLTENADKLPYRFVPALAGPKNFRRTGVWYLATRTGVVSRPGARMLAKNQYLARSAENPDESFSAKYAHAHAGRVRLAQEAAHDKPLSS